jgi:hypothetical protein
MQGELVFGKVVDAPPKLQATETINAGDAKDSSSSSSSTIEASSDSSSSSSNQDGGDVKPQAPVIPPFRFLSTFKWEGNEYSCVSFRMLHISDSNATIRTT